MMKQVVLFMTLITAARIEAGTFTVTDMSDDSLVVGSLRWAIGQANVNPGPDTILFDMDLFGNIYSVNDSALPAILDDFTLIRGDIDGDGTPDFTLQQTASGPELTGLEIRSSYNRIEYLAIWDFRSNLSGIYINGGSDNVVIGCDLQNNEHGVHIANGGRRNRIGDGTIRGRNYFINGNTQAILIEGTGSDSNEIAGNFIGVQSDNTFNGNDTAVAIASNAKYNRIGNGTLTGRNVLAAGGTGIWVAGAGTKYNVIRGNYIGTDSSGAGTAGYGHTGAGIAVTNGFGNVIGGTNPGDRNIVIGSGTDAISLNLADSTLVLGNYLGVDVAGAGWANVQSGIYINESDFVQAGDGSPAGRNVIGSNGFDGIRIEATSVRRAFGNQILGNYIGVGPDGVTPRGNAIHGIDIYAYQDSVSRNTISDNVIAHNGDQGIYILGDVVPANRNFIFRNSIHSNVNGGIFLDNNAQDFIPTPVLTLADIATGTVSGTADAEGNLIQIFADNGNQGRAYLDSVYAGTGGAFSKVLTGLPPNVNITALQSDSLNNTSAFSNTIATALNWRIVTTDADAGAGSLRDAIDSANTYAGPDTIRFSNPIMLGRQILVTGSDLSLTTGSTVIDGDVDGDSKPGVSIIDNGTPNWGIVIGSSNNVVRNLNIQKFNTAGILINGSRNNRIEGCYIGTSLDGMSASGTGNFWGIQIASLGVSANMIGDSNNVNARNVISGNSSEGIDFQNDADSTYVVGNYFGVDAAGTGALPNGTAIRLGQQTRHIHIGAGGPNGRNVISGNSNYSIYSEGSDIFIVNNYVGLNAAGTANLSNDFGLWLNLNASRTTIGLPSLGNVISGNNNYGIYLDNADSTVILANFIGTDATGSFGIGNNVVGIKLEATSENQIGDGTPGGRNVISGNAYGIELSTSPYNKVIGNYIGTNAAGTANVGNAGDGIRLSLSSSFNTIGDSLPGHGNVISGNGSVGLVIDGNLTISNNVYGNYIGTDAAGNAGIANGLQGISISNRSKHNRIGNGLASGRNIISGHTSQTGLRIFFSDSNEVRGNFIGLNAAGTSAIPNVRGMEVDSSRKCIVLGNTISGNTGNAITLTNSALARVEGNFLGTDGGGNLAVPNSFSGLMINKRARADSVLYNRMAFNQQFGIAVDGSQTDSSIFYQNLIYKNQLGGIWFQNGAQGGLVPPVISGIASDSTVSGTSQPNAFIQLFADSVGRGQGRFPLGTTTANGSGAWSRKVTLSSDLEVTALQDLSSTSAFSTPAIPFFGTLDVFGGTLNYGTVPVGDTATLPFRVFPVNGNVRIDSVSSLTEPAFQFFNSNVQEPDTLIEGRDTAFANIRFFPSANGTFRDTLTFYSAQDTIQIALEGEGGIGGGALFADQSSIAYGSVRLGDSSSAAIKVYAASGPVTVNQAIKGLPDFRIVSTPLPDTLAAGTDTLALTVRFVPQNIGPRRDTLRVMSNSTGGPLVIPLFGIGLENVPPVVDIYLLRSTVLKRYVDIMVAANEGLANVTGTLTLDSTTSPTFVPLPGNRRVFATSYRLEEGTLNISVNANDSAGNVGTDSRTYAVGTVAKEARSITHGNTVLSIPKNAFAEEAWILLTSRIVPTSSRRLSKGADRWIELGTRIGMMSTSDMREGERATLQVTFDESQLSECRNLPDYDERRIGLYQRQDGQWNYLGGEGSNGSVTGSLYRLGDVALFYNPDHVFLPKKVELSQNYPNPFNPTTAIRFGLPESGPIRLTVYNILGQRVTDLFRGVQQAGYHTYLWNGRNDQGQSVASGVYIYRLETPGGVLSRKMLLIK